MRMKEKERQNERERKMLAKQKGTEKKGREGRQRRRDKHEDER